MHGRVVLLEDVAALIADQQDGLVRLLRVFTADEGIEALDAVDQALFEQEVERSVDGGGLYLFAVSGETFDQVIGLGGLVAGPDLAQYMAPDGRQARAGTGADCLGAGEGIVDALVVMGARHEFAAIRNQ